MTTEPTHDLRAVLEAAFTGQERLSREEIRRRAMAADLSTDDLRLVDLLPEGEYAEDEAIEALREVDRLFELD